LTEFAWHHPAYSLITGNVRSKAAFSDRKGRSFTSMNIYCHIIEKQSGFDP